MHVLFNRSSLHLGSVKTRRCLAARRVLLIRKIVLGFNFDRMPVKVAIPAFRAKRGEPRSVLVRH